MALNEYFCDLLTILDNNMSAAGNAPYISNKLNGLLKVTSFGPLHELKLDEKLRVGGGVKSH